MSALLNTLFRPLVGFMGSPIKRSLLFIAILGIAAFVEFHHLGLARRTFVFYNVNGEGIVVEDRMLKRSGSKEGDVTRYTEEALLGPVAPDLLPLFPYGTRLKSLLYRNGVVYADLTSDAVLPSEMGGRAVDNFNALYGGILRNFSYVRDVRFFIEGNAAYAGGFGQGTAENGIFPEI